MGAKITIDSATLMNKGLEMIEAKWFVQPSARTDRSGDTPQSIIHSMVQFEDGSIKAQMGIARYETAHQYALGFPQKDQK